MFRGNSAKVRETQRNESSYLFIILYKLSLFKKLAILGSIENHKYPCTFQFSMKKEKTIKRHAKTCLRYPGGKFYGTKHIIPFTKVSHNNYIEIFAGGASIFLAKQKAKGINWINDIDPELINFYKVIQDRTTKAQLYNLLKNEVAHPHRHKEVLDIKPENNIERAFRYFYLNRTSFSGIMHKPRWGYALGSSITPDKWINIIEPVAKKLQGVKITNLDFKELLKEVADNPDTLIYADPPYFKASKAIYNHEFSPQDHIDLMNILKNAKAKFILSYENCLEIKEMYSWARIKEVTWKYFMSEDRRQIGTELIITNFPLEEQKALD